ncbi:MAG: PAS domain-containing protein [Acidobacteria bacterium]|nr:MAG: PAS domain-containing protein [Acidobacteriota bacterium]
MRLAHRTLLVAAGALLLASPLLDAALRLAAAGRWAAAVAIAASAAAILAGAAPFAARRVSVWLAWLRGVAAGRESEPPEDLPEEFAAVATGIDSRAKAERERRRIEAERARLLEAVLERLPDGVLLVEPGLRVRFANRAFRELTDVSDPTGRPVTELVRDPDLRESLERVLREARPGMVRVAVPPGGERRFEVRIVPEGGRALAFFRDVTRLDRLEAMRRRFVADVSHELRTPLTAIRAYVETLLEEAGAGTAAYAETILRHARRMEGLIDDLTDLSRIETGAVPISPRLVDVERSVGAALEQVAPARREKDVEVRLRLPPGLAVRADPKRLEQILVNLLDNAIKFNRPGGRVEIGGRRRPGWVELWVEDTGVGIAPEDRERIFERFFQADSARSPERKGTGLGLAIVKHLMERHGGRVECRSTPGRGSRFLLEFPDPPREDR